MISTCIDISILASVDLHMKQLFSVTCLLEVYFDAVLFNLENNYDRNYFVKESLDLM